MVGSFIDSLRHCLSSTFSLFCQKGEKLVKVVAMTYNDL
jgi:hypothetical protein